MTVSTETLPLSWMAAPHILTWPPIRNCYPEGTPQLGHARSLLRQLNRLRTAAWVPPNIMAATCRCQLAEAFTTLALSFRSMTCLAPLPLVQYHRMEYLQGRASAIGPHTCLQCWIAKRSHTHEQIHRRGVFLSGEERVDLGRARGGNDASLAASWSQIRTKLTDWQATLSCQEGIILSAVRWFRDQIKAKSV